MESSRRSVEPGAGAYRALRGVTATAPTSRRAVTPRNGRDKPARCPLTTNIGPFPATHQSGFPSVPSHNEAANKKVPIIAYMLSLAITTIIELFCLAPHPFRIPYGSTPLGCIRLLCVSASLQRRAACPQAGAVAFVACSYRRKPTNAPAASSRAESPRPRIGFYYRLWLRTARRRAALHQSTALRPSRHAAREKAGRAGRAGTKAACPLTQWGNSGASRPYGVPANAPLLSLPRPLSFVPALSPCAACLSSSRATWLRHYVD